MNTDLLIDAIGEIDEDKIRSAKMVSVKTKKKSIKHFIIIAAAILLCITITVTTLAATVNPVYDLVYQISPGLAQMMKPVQMSCEDNGIRMEVESASVYENEAAVYISLEDLTDQNRIDETTDLFDSYSINQGFDSYSTCSYVSFDKETSKATFLINITRADGNKIEGNKITFDFTTFISKKSYYNGRLWELDLSKAVEAKDTFTPEFHGASSGKDTDFVSEWFCGENGIKFDIDYFVGTKCLVPVDGGIASPTDGVKISNIGFIDNKLHVQVYYEDTKNFDDHGFIDIRDKYGEAAECFDLSFDDDNEIGTYYEYIYNINPDEAEKYIPFGNFVTCKNRTEGFWQVTFPLEDN